METEHFKEYTRPLLASLDKVGIRDIDDVYNLLTEVQIGYISVRKSI